ncbi:MAG: hypothetical protein JWN02_26, partial [Acidobacteria bacterium]|nr:hypothetical protein [Acidobacteriota bacterium]
MTNVLVDSSTADREKAASGGLRLAATHLEKV